MSESSTPGKFFAKVCSIAARTSAEYNMLSADCRVLAALSGGPDSMIMLETLIALRKRAPFKFALEAVTFDPGFPQFNAHAVAEYCQARGIKHSIITLNMAPLLEVIDGERARRPCVRCSRLRRGKLYGFARENGYNRLALGHHADDLLGSFLISLLRGQGLTTMGPNVPADEDHAANGELRIIRPLAMIPEAVVKQAASEFDFPAAGACPFKAELDASGDRAWAKRQLETWSERIPNLRTLMLKSLGKAELNWLLDKRYISVLKNHNNN